MIRPRSGPFAERVRVRTTEYSTSVVGVFLSPRGFVYPAGKAIDGAYPIDCSSIVCIMQLQHADEHKKRQARAPQINPHIMHAFSSESRPPIARGCGHMPARWACIQKIRPLSLPPQHPYLSSRPGVGHAKNVKYLKRYRLHPAVRLCVGVAAPSRPDPLPVPRPAYVETKPPRRARHMPAGADRRQGRDASMIDRANLLFYIRARGSPACRASTRVPPL